MNHPKTSKFYTNVTSLDNSLFYMYVVFDLCLYYIDAFFKLITLFTLKLSFLYVNLSVPTVNKNKTNNINTKLY